IASISRIVMLVSESPGSIAELGAFSQIDEIRLKLLVFIHSNHYSANSFIKYGPIRYLENTNQKSVQEFDWQKNNRGNLTLESTQRHLASFKSAADSFLKSLPQAESFKVDNVGHCIMLIAGVIFTLRCCKLREVVEATKLLGLEFTESRIKQYIFCLKLVGWLKLVKRDVQYHIYVADRSPIVFRGPGPISDFARFDPVRVRYDILQSYEKDDPRLTVLDSVAT
ncbi:MAG: retron St85 family effector protein, partial [Hyphomicrobium sp.]